MSSVSYSSRRAQNLADTVRAMRAMPKEYTVALRLECGGNIWPQMLFIKPHEACPELDRHRKRRLQKVVKRTSKGRGRLKVSSYSRPWINEEGYSAVWGKGHAERRMHPWRWGRAMTYL